MKESEFIELLNLYLDHEISAADAARLEAAVQSDPARRKVYQQYCRMQKACKMLTADFQPAEAGVAATEKKVLPFDATAVAQARGRRVSGLYTLGGFVAAAACIALIFVNRGSSPAATGANANGSPLVKSVPAAPAAARPMTVVDNQPRAPRSLGSRPASTLVDDPLFLTGKSATEEAIATAQSDSNPLAWINALQIAPIQPRVPADELRFTQVPATMRPEARALGGNRAPAEANVEMTAFRFVK
jgi:hypothetical protein